MALLDQLPSSFIYTIIIPVKLFRIIGLDFFDDDARVGNYCKFIINFCLGFAFSIGLLFFFINIKELDAGVLEIADAIPFSGLVIHSICKLLLIRNKKLLLRKVVHDVAELWPGEDQTQDKKELMEFWLRRTRTICEGVVKLTISGLLLYDGMSLIVYVAIRLSNGNPAYMLPFTLYYPFEINALWKYLLVYLMQILATVMIYECSYLACDMFLFALTFDVSMLFRLLQHDLVNITVERRGRGAEESLENLKNIVKRHQKILKVAETLDEIFGAIVFTVLMFSSLIICFFGFLSIQDIFCKEDLETEFRKSPRAKPRAGMPQLMPQFCVTLTSGCTVFFITIAKEKDSCLNYKKVVYEKFRQLLYLMAAMEVLISVFYIMWPGQVLSDTSSGVADAAYESLWYESDVRFRKMLVIIITRSQKPCKLRAKGYADVNFETFYKICGTTWSYLTVVNQMYQNLMIK